MGEGKRDHRDFPDFVIVKKTGEFYIIEVKAENKRGDKTAEAKKRQWSSCRRCSQISSDITSSMLRNLQ